MWGSIQAVTRSGAARILKTCLDAGISQEQESKRSSPRGRKSSLLLRDRRPDRPGQFPIENTRDHVNTVNKRITYLNKTQKSDILR